MKSIHFTGTEQEGDSVRGELCQDPSRRTHPVGRLSAPVVGGGKRRVTKTTVKVLPFSLFKTIQKNGNIEKKVKVQVPRKKN